ncbi:hypothetical protein HMPREF1624_07409 [Sporothrix schenckii ATCC 58251]|uniref:Uncharacterized protein n=1 Tax=Sporothrix schenckii (strain ATCC 58251 / de Perez 2211183) TaxID=1391915 RepID=U7PP43_SPOS1|nr:hypothetical protein HMPREF1624_07409 [Sporothrix schenckii ATCC 58251]
MTEPSDFTDEERALFDRLNIGKAGGLPLPSFIRPSEVVAQARPLADAIFQDWAALKALVTPHESLLHDRWKSLKKRKRRDLIQEAWTMAAAAVSSVDDDDDGNGTPTALPLPHRPDLVAWRRREREKGQQLKDSSTGGSAGGGSSSFAAPENLVTLLDWTADDRAAFLWPHLSLQDLALRPSSTRALWLLATSRAAAPPEAFAAADLATTRLGKACLALLPRYLNQYSMLFAGRTSPATYGQLYTWAELEALTADQTEAPGSDSFATRGTHPGEGLWILTVQARLYRFLVLAVRAILGAAADGNGEVSEKKKEEGKDKANDTASNGKNGHTEPSTETSVLDTPAYVDQPLRSLETPYRVPPTSLDTQHLQALLDMTNAKVWEAEDHVWALRTDPAYLRATLRDWALHRKERLTTTDGVAPAESETETVSPTVVDACLRRALEQAETWNLVYSKVHLLAQQMEKHAAAVAAAQAGPDAGRLPRDVLLSFYALYYHIRSFENEPVGLLQTGAFSAPAVRQHYRLERDAETDDGKTHVVAAEGADAPPLVGDESDGHAATAGRDSGQPVAAALWSLTGLQDDATRQLFGRQTLLDELEAASRATGLLSAWTADQVATVALYARCTLLLDAFQPWAAAYDQTVQQDTEVRDILVMDFHMSMGHLRALLEHGLDVAAPSFVGRDAAATTTDKDAGELAIFWATVYQTLDANKALTPRLRDMLTREDDKYDKALFGSGSGSGSGVDRRLVDRRAARVFRALFPPSDGKGSTATPATLTWPDVVHALQTAGFTAERLYGSAWLFVPGPVAKMAAIVATAKGAGRRGADKNKSTTPRPSLFRAPVSADSDAPPKLAPADVRWIGKRLQRAYGWNAMTFAAE